MKMSEQTTLQIERFIRKIAQKFPVDKAPSLLSDIHRRVSQDSGEMISFDDDDVEITRCVVEQWIDNNEEDFYKYVESALHKSISKLHDIVDAMGIMKPYSFILENDEREHIAELYLADNDTVIIGGDLMGDLNEDLNSFFEKLMKEKD